MNSEKNNIQSADTVPDILIPGEFVIRNVPHQAIVTINIDTYERLPSGQVMPPPKFRYAKIYSVLGENLAECQQKLDTFLKKNLPHLNKEKDNEQN